MVISVRGLMTVILIQTLFPTSKLIALENALATMRLIQERCVKCHGKDGKVKGKVDLLKLDSFDKLSSHPDLIKEMIDALDTGARPGLPCTNEPLNAKIENGNTLVFQTRNAVTDQFQLKLNKKQR